MVDSLNSNSPVYACVKTPYFIKYRSICTICAGLISIKNRKRCLLKENRYKVGIEGRV